MRRPGVAWVALAAMLALCAIGGWWLPRIAIDWEPDLASRQPWRAWTAVGVHYSRLHLAANLAGTALVAAYGVVGRLPGQAALAWFAAWPLTQAGLLMERGLVHYGGLSGVLHAGMAVAAVSLLGTGTRAQRGVAGAVLFGLLAKIVNEQPWGPPLRHPAGWDIAVAPLAHATGAAAGVACGIIALLITRRTHV